MTARWWLLIILIAAVTLRVVLVLVLPYDAGPDERRRYGVATAIYTTNHAPRYGSEGGPSYVVKPILSYRLNAWIARAVPGPLALLQKFRIGSTVIAALTILLAFALCRNLWPTRIDRALALATVLAFHPQFLFVGSYLNADAYTIGANTLVLYLLTLVHRRGQLTPALAAALGGSLGLLFLGREYGYAGFFLVLGYAIFLLRRSWSHNGRLLALSLAIFLVFPTSFYLHQYFQYGKAFIPVVVGSGVAWVPPGWSVGEAYQHLPTEGLDYIVSRLRWGNAADWLMLLTSLFTSSFGTFGYLDISMPWPFYSGYLAILVAGMIGLSRSIGRSPTESAVVRSRRWLIGSVAVAIISLIVVVIRHNFVVLFQAQGRYLLPLVVPAMLLLVIGWQRVIRQSAPTNALTACGTGFFVLSGSFAVGLLIRYYV